MPPGAFEEKLAEARANQSQTRKRIFGYGALAAGVALFAGVLVWLLVQLDLAREKLRQAEQSRPQNAVTETIPSIADAVIPDEAADAVDETAAGDDEVFRRQFMQALAQYENEIEPQLEAISLPDRAGDKHAELETLKTRALESFSAGDYLAARESLRRAADMAAAAITEYTDRLAAAKHAAKQAFNADRAPEAAAAVGEALQLAPDDEEMRALQKRIEVMPQVLELLQQAGAARSENRPEKEAAALQQVVALDPSRGQAASRLQKLRAQSLQQSKQRQFSAAIRDAASALDAGDLAAAQQHIDLAKTIFPAAEDIAPLQARVQQAKADLEFARQTALGEQAKQRDDWQAAADAFGRALQLKPNEPGVVENHTAALRVVEVSQRVVRLLGEEQRLGDKAVADSVAAYLREVEPAAELSPVLQKNHLALTRMVESYNTEVEVIVVSDNKTHIIVRGVGQVGKTERRAIRLRPGTRVFEGSRSGYKSKLVTLNLKPGAPAVEVTVVCDEKI